MDVVLVKLGGGLITHKDRNRSVRKKVLRRLAAELAAASGPRRPRVLLGHGSGSFGHQAAVEAGLGQVRPLGAKTRTGVVRVQEAAHQLHLLVLRHLRHAEVPAFSLPASAWAIAQDGTVIPSPAGASVCAAALQGHLVPVTGGDVALQADHKVGVVSTEAVLGALARTLIQGGHRIVRALWLGNTDGVYDDGGQTVSHLRISNSSVVLGGSDSRDVTGGMALRVQAARDLAELGIPSWILDGREPGVLDAALRGKRKGGTLIAADG